MADEKNLEAADLRRKQDEEAARARREEDRRQRDDRLAAEKQASEDREASRDKDAPQGIVQTPGLAKPDDNYKEEASNNVVQDARDARERPMPESTLSEMEAGQKALEKHQPTRATRDRFGTVEEAQDRFRNQGAPRRDDDGPTKPKVAEAQDPSNPNLAKAPGTAEMNTPNNQRRGTNPNSSATDGT